MTSSAEPSAPDPPGHDSPVDDLPTADSPVDDLPTADSPGQSSPGQESSIQAPPGAQSPAHDPARPCTRFGGDDLTDADPTPGMHRRLATHSDGMWTGTVDTAPQAVTGWHHHGEHETTLYIVSGRFRLESGPNGENVIEAGPGDFIRVPAGAIHRESNPGETTSRAVIVRCGSGEPTVNVAGPAAG